MEYQTATLNGVRGKGYAKALGTGAGRRRCDGVFFTTSEAVSGPGRTGIGAGRATFSGVVYDTEQAAHVDCDVLITSVRQTGERETVIHFMTFLSADVATQQQEM